MSTGATAITDQAGVNSAESFDAAAESVLGLDSVQAEPVVAGGAADAGDDQPGGDRPGSKEAGVTDANAGTAAKPADQQVAAADAATVDPWAIDEKGIQGIIGDATHGPIVKALYEKFQQALQQVKGYGEFFATPEDARTFKALAPGGVEELKGRLELAQSAEKENADFMSGDPERQKSALTAIAEENPEVFASGLPMYLDLVAAKSPEAFQKTALDMAKRGLEGEGVPALWQAVMDAAAKEDEKGFGEAFGKFSEWMTNAGLAKAGAAAASPRTAANPELEKANARIKELEAAQHEQTVTNFKSWWEPTQKEIGTAVRADIQKRVEEFLPKNVPAAFREDLLTRIIDQVENEVVTQMRADRGHQGKLADVLKDNAWKTKGEDARKQYVNLSTGRATQLLPFAVAKVMEPYTKAAVASAAAKTEKETAQAGRKDVSGGGGAPVKTQALNQETLKKMEKDRGRRLTEEEILDM